MKTMKENKFQVSDSTAAGLGSTNERKASFLGRDFGSENKIGCSLGHIELEVPIRYSRLNACIYLI